MRLQHIPLKWVNFRPAPTIGHISRWAVALQARAGYGKALVAIVAKNARIAWALLAKGECDFSARWRHFVSGVKAPFGACVSGTRTFFVRLDSGHFAVRGRAGGNKQFESPILPSPNHLFQNAKTGAIEEFGSIEETMAPIALFASKQRIKCIVSVPYRAWHSMAWQRCLAALAGQKNMRSIFSGGEHVARECEHALPVKKSKYGIVPGSLTNGVAARSLFSGQQMSLHRIEQLTVS